jgi:hypothetical protein
MEEQFRVRRIVAHIALDEFGVIIPPQNFLLDEKVKGQVRLLLALATKEETIAEIPADWWQHFKERWFSERMLRRWPVRKLWVVAYHKYPELPIPDIGREFVDVRIIPQPHS